VVLAVWDGLGCICSCFCAGLCILVSFVLLARLHIGLGSG
jgi:hypothetical protein